MGSEHAGGDGGRIREFRSGDVAEVEKIIREAREAAQWSQPELRNMGELGGLKAYVSETSGGISGIVIGRQVADEGEILNLAVRAAKRRSGEGKRLVERILEEFSILGISRVFLEVRESNAGAIAFYEGMGFREIGRRSDYYQDPKEAARVMELWLRKSTEQGEIVRTRS